MLLKDLCWDKCLEQAVFMPWFLEKDIIFYLFNCIFWCFQWPMLSAVQFNYIWKKADISSVDFARTHTGLGRVDKQPRQRQNDKCIGMYRHYISAIFNGKDTVICQCFEKNKFSHLFCSIHWQISFWWNVPFTYSQYFYWNFPFRKSCLKLTYI